MKRLFLNGIISRMKNFYKVLGIKSAASNEEIKTSYRRLAKIYHPDVNPGNKAAESRFTDINEAYETLMDSAKKEEYDKVLMAAIIQKTSGGYASSASGASSANFASGGYSGGGYSGGGYSGGFNGAYSGFSSNGYGYNQNPGANSQNVYASFTPTQINSIKSESYKTGYNAGFMEAQKVSANENALLKKQLSDTIEKLSKATENAKTLNEEVRKTHLNKREEAAFTKRQAETLLKEEGELKVKLSEQDDQIKKFKAQVEYLLSQRAAEQTKVSAYEKELALMMEENLQLKDNLTDWEEYQSKENLVSDFERIKYDWELKLKEDKKKAKKTHYGTLGVLIWAYADEIKESYTKLVKRYAKKAETDEKTRQKLYELNAAYKVLSDEDARAKYDLSLDVTAEDVEAERIKKLEYDEVVGKMEKDVLEDEFIKYVEELKYSADTGDADAQNTLGELYYFGDELDKDLKSAIYWFKEAAKQRHPEGLYNLGNCFLTGEGVEKDIVKGNGFIKQAKSLGFNVEKVK